MQCACIKIFKNKTAEDLLYLMLRIWTFFNHWNILILLLRVKLLWQILPKQRNLPDSWGQKFHWKEINRNFHLSPPFMEWNQNYPVSFANLKQQEMVKIVFSPEPIAWKRGSHFPVWFERTIQPLLWRKKAERRSRFISATCLRNGTDQQESGRIMVGFML